MLLAWYLNIKRYTQEQRQVLMASYPVSGSPGLMVEQETLL